MPDNVQLLEKALNIATEMKSNYLEAEKRNETSIAEITAKLTRMNEAYDALKDEIIKNTEAKNAPPSLETKDKSAVKLKDAFEDYLLHGQNNITDETKSVLSDYRASVKGFYQEQPGQKAHTVNDASRGGYTVFPELDMNISNKLYQVSPFRSVAFVRPTTSNSVIHIVEDANYSAEWLSETATRNETDGLNFESREIFTRVLSAKLIVSELLLEDSTFNIQAELERSMPNKFAIAEGKAFINGAGPLQPEGILQNSEISYVAGGDASLIILSSLVNLIYGLPTPYANAPGASLLMNRNTLGKVRLLRDDSGASAGTGAFVWQPSYQLGQPDTILSKPVVEMVDMPDIASNAFPVLFGDFNSAYVIVDRVGTVIRRLTEAYAENGKVAFLARRRVGGGLILPEAVRKLKISTS